MTEETTAETHRIARRYFDAWTARDTPAAASVLAEGFTFTSDAHRIEGREAFLDAGAFPPDATTEMVAEAYQGEIAFQMYDSNRGDRSVRIVELLEVQDGLITSSTFVTDMTAFMDFVSR